jgi:hypothetical protein
MSPLDLSDKDLVLLAVWHTPLRTSISSTTDIGLSSETVNVLKVTGIRREIFDSFFKAFNLQKRRRKEKRIF